MSVSLSGRRLPCVLTFAGACASQVQWSCVCSCLCTFSQDSTRSIRTCDYMTLFNCHMEWENNLAVWTGKKPKVKICHDGCYLGRHSPTSDNVCLVAQEREVRRVLCSRSDRRSSYRIGASCRRIFPGHFHVLDQVFARCWSAAGRTHCLW